MPIFRQLYDRAATRATGLSNRALPWKSHENRANGIARAGAGCEEGLARPKRGPSAAWGGPTDGATGRQDKAFSAADLVRLAGVAGALGVVTTHDLGGIAFTKWRK